jgi:hypothetical protein
VCFAAQLPPVLQQPNASDAVARSPQARAVLALKLVLVRPAPLLPTRTLQRAHHTSRVCAVRRRFLCAARRAAPLRPVAKP